MTIPFTVEPRLNHNHDFTHIISDHFYRTFFFFFIYLGTNHQAALGPAVALSDKTALLLAFLYAATTNLVSNANAAASRDSDDGTQGTNIAEESPQGMLVGSLQLSSYVGLGLSMILFTFAKPLLSLLMCGKLSCAGIDPKVFGPALQYVRIRALGMPAAAFLGSAQAACLGLQDIRSPLMVLGAAAFLNLIGDFVFVRSKAALLGGAAGAAWATILSQYCATFLFVEWLKNMKSKKKSKSNRFSVRGFLSTDNTKQAASDREYRRSDLIKFPTIGNIKNYIPYVVPVTTTSVGRVSLFLSMAHVISSCSGTIGLASHQIVLSIFDAFCPVLDSLSLTAQAFVPSALAKFNNKADGTANNRVEERRSMMRTLTMNFMKSGLLFGGFVAACMFWGVPQISRYFTNDLRVLSEVNSMAPYLTGIFGLHGLVTAAEGLLLGTKDLNFLGGMYGLAFLVVPAIMMKQKGMNLLSNAPFAISKVWRVFLMYQITRCALWVSRVLWLSLRGSVTDSSSSPSSGEVESNLSSHKKKDLLENAIHDAILQEMVPQETSVPEFITDDDLVLDPLSSIDSIVLDDDENTAQPIVRLDFNSTALVSTSALLSTPVLSVKPADPEDYIMEIMNPDEPSFGDI